MTAPRRQHQAAVPTRRVSCLAAACLCAALLSGCETVQDYSLTHKVWTRSGRPSSRPAPDPRLAIYSSPGNLDVLVVYDALSERNDTVVRRAYFVLSNEVQILARKRPVYVSMCVTTNLLAVPIFSPSNSAPSIGLAARYPVSTDNGAGFELFRDGSREGEHSLPVYDEGLGTPSRIALTPLAVAGDTLMVAAVTGFVAAIAWLQSGCPGL